MTTLTISEGVQTDRITIEDSAVLDVQTIARAGTITVSDTAPADPEVGDLWIQT